MISKLIKWCSHYALHIQSLGFEVYARILKAHSHSMSGNSIWASLECRCCFWIAWVLVSYLTMSRPIKFYKILFLLKIFLSGNGPLSHNIGNDFFDSRFSSLFYLIGTLLTIWCRILELEASLDERNCLTMKQSEESLLQR
jgi:hypothetical protein